MKEINISKTLIAKRKEKAITQDELAAYIGVSKASVSKWETGQSYPDITFLPQLAAYFNISIDELIGYEPQMTKEDIRKLYYRLAAEFGNKPFDEVLKECHQIIKKYYSCFPLLLQMAILLTNHYMLAKEKDTQEAVLNEIINLCQRIKTEDDDMSMLREANSLEATCHLVLQQPEKVLELLDGTMKPSTSDEVVLATAYQMTGNVQKAKEVLQAGMYFHLVVTAGIIPRYLLLYIDTPERYDAILQRALSMADIFEFDVLHPGVMLQIYFAAAYGYTIQNNQAKALCMLKKYAFICTTNAVSYKLHGDKFFDSIDNYFKEFDLGGQAPRDMKVINKGILDAVTENPAFAVLADNIEYKNIIETMKIKLGGC